MMCLSPSPPKQRLVNRPLIKTLQSASPMLTNAERAPPKSDHLDNLTTRTPLLAALEGHKLKEDLTFVETEKSS